MADKRKWIGMGYNLPINPSKNRVYIWRKLKEIGAVYYKQGVAVLPYQKEKVALFRALADKIIEMGGEASLIEIRFLDARDEKEIIAKLAEQAAVEYREILLGCNQILQKLYDDPEKEITELKNSDTLKKMIRHYQQIQARDHFKLPISKEIEYLFLDISSVLRLSVKDLSKQFSKILDMLESFSKL